MGGACLFIFDNNHIVKFIIIQARAVSSGIYVAGSSIARLHLEVCTRVSRSVGQLLN